MGTKARHRGHYSGDAEVQGPRRPPSAGSRRGPSAHHSLWLRFDRVRARSPGSPLPQFAFLTFLGLPDFGGGCVNGRCLGATGPLFAFPLTLSLPDFATSNHGERVRISIRSNGPRAFVHGGPGARLRSRCPSVGAILLLLVTVHGVDVDAGPEKGQASRARSGRTCPSRS